jgi:hypothetical protein
MGRHNLLILAIAKFEENTCLVVYCGRWGEQGIIKGTFLQLFLENSPKNYVFRSI